MRSDVSEDFTHVVAVAYKVGNHSVTRSTIGTKNIGIAQADRLESLVYLALGKGFTVGQFDAERFRTVAGFIALGIGICERSPAGGDSGPSSAGRTPSFEFGPLRQ